MNKLEAEIESLQAKLAMQAEALNHVDTKGHNNEGYKLVKDTLNATKADVDAFMQGKKAEWEKERNPKCATHGYGCGLHESTCKREV